MPHTVIMKFFQNYWSLLYIPVLNFFFCTQLSGQPGRHNHLDQDPGAVARPGGPDQGLTHHTCCAVCVPPLSSRYTLYTAYTCVYCTYLLVDIWDGQFSLETSQSVDLKCNRKYFFDCKYLLQKIICHANLSSVSCVTLKETYFDFRSSIWKGDLFVLTVKGCPLSTEGVI